MRKIIAAALAGAAATEAARRATRAARAKRTPDPAWIKRHNSTRGWNRHGMIPATWPDAIQAMTRDITRAAASQARAIALRAGVPVPCKPRPTMFGPAASAELRRRRYDPYDDNG
jgi:hypothetical protein